MTNPVSVGIFPEGTDKEKTFDRATAQVRRSVPVCWIRNPVHSEVRLQYHFKCHHIIYPVIPRKLQPPIMLLIAVRQSAGLSTITAQHIKSCNSCICIVLLPEIICSNWKDGAKAEGNTYTVYIQRQTCGCFAWQRAGTINAHLIQLELKEWYEFYIVKKAHPEGEIHDTERERQIVCQTRIRMSFQRYDFCNMGTRKEKHPRLAVYQLLLLKC